MPDETQRDTDSSAGSERTLRLKEADRSSQKPSQESDLPEVSYEVPDEVRHRSHLLASNSIDSGVEDEASRKEFEAGMTELTPVLREGLDIPGSSVSTATSGPRATSKIVSKVQRGLSMLLRPTVTSDKSEEPGKRTRKWLQKRRNSSLSSQPSEGRCFSFSHA